MNHCLTSELVLFEQVDTIFQLVETVSVLHLVSVVAVDVDAVIGKLFPNVLAGVRFERLPRVFAIHIPAELSDKITERHCSCLRQYKRVSRISQHIVRADKVRCFVAAHIFTARELRHIRAGQVAIQVFP